MQNKFIINGREISDKFMPYIIAEISANHNGSLKKAKEIIKAAKETGVNAVKIQSYTPDTMTINTSKKDFVIQEGIWSGRTLYDLYQEAHTPYEWHAELFQYSKKLGITIFSSAFDESAVDLLESLDTPAYKIASFEIVDLPLIKYIARTKKPLLMSTGMASFEEIANAIDTAKINGNNNILVFHCISSYPTPTKEANIRAIKTLKDMFKVEVGLSDHTLSNTASILATSFGAAAIEKHFTLSRDQGGVDSSFSLEPSEMKILVNDINDAFHALTSVKNIRSSIENKNKIFRRSIYFVKNIKKGQKISEMHVKRIRPGFGLDARFYDDVIGKICLKDAVKGERLTFKHFKKN